MGTAIRVATNARRLAHKRHEVASDPLPEPVVGADWTKSGADAPDQVLAERELVRLLDRVLSQLPEALRTIYVLGEVEELSRRELARILELPTGTVASRLRKARKEVCRIAAEMCGTEGDRS
jgi:RNA polymerase sigma-70 factor (ECF subfamily)